MEDKREKIELDDFVVGIIIDLLEDYSTGVNDLVSNEVARSILSLLASRRKLANEEV